MRITSLVALLAAVWGGVQAADLPFEVVEARYEVLEREQTFDAVIEAVQRATVSAQTSGRILEVNFDVDDYVNKDEVLLRIRDREQRAALQSAEARLQEAKANFDRLADLLERKLISKSEFDRAEAALEAARAGVAQAREQLEHTVVRAPYSGIVVERHVEPGESTSPGSPLMTGLSLEKLRATANVSQAYIDEVRERGQASVILPAQDGESTRVQGIAVTVSPYADPRSHTFRVRVELPEGRHGVYPGMFAKVSFVVGEERRLVVPTQAVVYRSEVSAVYVVRSDDSVDFRQVRVGRAHESRTEILAGLAAGERVALDPIRAGVHLKETRAGGGR